MLLAPAWIHDCVRTRVCVCGGGTVSLSVPIKWTLGAVTTASRLQGHKSLCLAGDFTCPGLPE